MSVLARAKKERLCLSVRDNMFLLLIVRKSWGLFGLIKESCMKRMGRVVHNLPRFTFQTSSSLRSERLCRQSLL